MIQISQNIVALVTFLAILQAFVSLIIGYIWGSKAERRQAVLHGLAEWVPYTNGSPKFAWRDDLPMELDNATGEIERLNLLLDNLDSMVDKLHNEVSKLEDKLGKPDAS